MKRALVISLLALCAVACHEPNPLGFQPDEHPERVSIAYLKSLYRTAPVRIDHAMQIEGHIVANDFNGNLHNELSIADSTGGIIVRLNAERLYRRFWQGARIVVRCSGLWLGSSGGTIELGAEPTGEYEVDNIPTDEIGLYISIDTTRQIEITARPTLIAECTPEMVSTLVRVEGVQFSEEELMSGWCDWALDSLTSEWVRVATTRHLIDSQGDTLDVRTSPFADFARTSLPSGSGSIEGLLGYFNRRYQLRVLNSYHIQMDALRF